MKENKSNKIKFKDIYIVVNEKGGVGKSTIAMQVLAPVLYLNNINKHYFWEMMKHLQHLH
jgi:hypothetical protein